MYSKLAQIKSRTKKYRKTNYIKMNGYVKKSSSATDLKIIFKLNIQLKY